MAIARKRVSPSARRRRQVDIARARQDPNAFVEYVFGVTQEPVHRAWQKMWLTKEHSVVHGSVGIGKTVQARGFALWLLGRDPGEQIIWLGATQRQPRKNLHSLAAMIEHEGPRSKLHHVFPNLRPGPIWRSTEIEIDRDVSPIDADPTVQVYGAYSDSILGSRATTLIIDDLCNFSNTLTEDGRSKMIEWLAGTVLSRLTKRRIRIIVLGNFWHKTDATMDLVRNKGFSYRRDPAYRIDPATGERVLTAPTVLGHKEIIRLEKTLGPVQSERMLQCRAADLEIGRFRASYFERALEKGRGLEFRPNRVFGPCFTGVDLGHRKKPGADRTAMVTCLLRDDKRRQIVDVRSGNWSGGEIKAQLVDVRLRYGSTIGVENNAAQKIVMDLISDATAIPLNDHNTNINKYHSANGIEALAQQTDLGFWIFPCPKDARLDEDWGMIDDEGNEEDWTTGGQPHPEIQALVNEALVFDPTKHPGDRLMGWWICEETIRRSAAGALLDIEAASDVVSMDLFSR